MSVEPGCMGPEALGSAYRAPWVGSIEIRGSALMAVASVRCVSRVSTSIDLVPKLSRRTILTSWGSGVRRAPVTSSSNLHPLNQDNLSYPVGKND